MRQCPAPGCRVLVHCGRCEAHERERRQQHDHGRGTAHQRGYTARWARASKSFLLEHPLCVLCSAAGRLTGATLTDHRIPHRGDMTLFWDRRNWQALCNDCHNRKPEDRRFGRPPDGGGRVPEGFFRRTAALFLASFLALPEVENIFRIICS